MIEFTIPCAAIGKGRPRVTRHGVLVDVYGVGVLITAPTRPKKRGTMSNWCACAFREADAPR